MTNRTSGIKTKHLEPQDDSRRRLFEHRKPIAGRLRLATWLMSQLKCANSSSNVREQHEWDRKVVDGGREASHSSDVCADRKTGIPNSGMSLVLDKKNPLDRYISKHNPPDQTWQSTRERHKPLAHCSGKAWATRLEVAHLQKAALAAAEWSGTYYIRTECYDGYTFKTYVAINKVCKQCESCSGIHSSDLLQRLQLTFTMLVKISCIVTWLSTSAVKLL